VTQTPQIRQPADVDALRRRAEPWLLEAEAENNLILSLIDKLRQGRRYGEKDPYFFTVEQGGELVGCALRTPPHFPLAVTRMPGEALGPLVRRLAEIDPELTAVMGPREVVEPFAEEWTLVTGRRSEPGRRQRIYELTEVIPPERPVSSTFRRAGIEDVELTTRWGAAFDREVEFPQADSRARARAWIEDGGLFLWEDDAEGSEPGSVAEPVCMAVAVGFTRLGARIGFVYTPPEHRGSGYATACTAALSRLLLEQGRRFCCLYTDLANPTSNHIYQQIGYRPVCDVAEAWFTEDESDEG
jgi:GNAT superfamily N-acetyltransferase